MVHKQFILVTVVEGGTRQHDFFFTVKYQEL